MVQGPRRGQGHGSGDKEHDSGTKKGQGMVRGQRRGQGTKKGQGHGQGTKKGSGVWFGTKKGSGHGSGLKSRVRMWVLPLTSWVAPGKSLFLIFLMG